MPLYRTQHTDNLQELNRALIARNKKTRAQNWDRVRGKADDGDSTFKNQTCQHQKFWLAGLHKPRKEKKKGSAKLRNDPQNTYLLANTTPDPDSDRAIKMQY